MHHIFKHTPRCQRIRLCRPDADDALQLPIIMGYAHPWSHTHIKNLGGLVLSIITICLWCFYKYFFWSKRKLCKIKRPSLWQLVLQRDRKSMRWGACRLWEKYVRVHALHVGYACVQNECMLIFFFHFLWIFELWSIASAVLGGNQLSFVAYVKHLKFDVREI